ncbi:MAG: polyprenyl synthetase family protein [Chloroflexi bacterium]|nr:polyprenyl synthetase family protein [Chloroflexota bacterium]
MRQPSIEEITGIELANLISITETEMRALLRPEQIEEHSYTGTTLSPPLGPFYGMLLYHLGWADAAFQPAAFPGGKRLRPAMLLMACQAVGGDPQRAAPAAAAIELVHNFSLIHDDIEDGDKMRHGRPTLWTLVGISQAVNAGDALFVLARLALHNLAQQGYDTSTIQHCFELFDRACLSLTQGQYQDISFEQRWDVSLTECLQMIYGKTAALLEAALQIGALLGGATPTQQGYFRELGRNLGLAFQIRDDILGIWGEETRTGKSAGNDIARKKKSLPVVYALQELQATSPENWQMLNSLYQQPDLSPSDISAVREILENSGAYAYAQRLATTHHQQALEALQRATGDTLASRSLHSLANFLLRRDY